MQNKGMAKWTLINRKDESESVNKVGDSHRGTEYSGQSEQKIKEK